MGMSAMTEDYSQSTFKWCSSPSKCGLTSASRISSTSRSRCRREACSRTRCRHLKCFEVREKIGEVGVTVTRGAITVGRSEKRTLHQDDLCIEDLGPSLQQGRTRVGAVGQNVGFDVFGDFFAGVPACCDLGFGEMTELGPESAFVPDDPGAEGRDPVVGGEEDQLDVASELVSRALSNPHHSDLVGFAALEPGEVCQQGVDLVGDGFGNQQRGRRHGVEIALGGPITEPPGVVHVTVTEDHGSHGRQGAVCAAGVETEVQLRQKNDRALSGSGSTDETQIAPRRRELELAQRHRLTGSSG